MQPERGRVDLPSLLRLARHDLSAWVLLASNLLAIVLAVVERWSLVEIMAVYWCQSVVIGLFSALRMLRLKDFESDGVKLDGEPLPPTPATARKLAGFFAMHYGSFHLGYAFFLLIFAAEGSMGGLNAGRVAVGALVFFLNHLFSYLYNRESPEIKPHIGRVMLFPYLRIVPMHLTIIFGILLKGWGIVLFLGLKTFADLLMHLIEHAREKPIR